MAIALLAVQAATGAGTTSPVTDLQTERKRLRAAAIRADAAQARSDRANREAAIAEHNPTSGYDWDSVAACEGWGDWSLVTTGNGYYWVLQFAPSTWLAYGGTQAELDAGVAPSRERLIEIAENVAFHGYGPHAPQGLGAWPNCSH